MTFEGTRADLSGAKGEFAGRIDTTARTAVSGVASVSANGGLSARDAARLAADVPVLGQEPKYAQALEAALRRFTVSAPSVDVAAGAGGFTLSPRRPLALAAASGAKLNLTPNGLRLLDDGLAGGLALTVEGGGLPAIALTAPSLSLRDGELDAQTALTTTLDFSLARNLALTTAGRARYGRAGVFLRRRRLRRGQGGAAGAGRQRRRTPLRGDLSGGRGAAGGRRQAGLANDRTPAGRPRRGSIRRSQGRGRRRRFRVASAAFVVGAEVALTGLIDTAKDRRHALQPLVEVGQRHDVSRLAHERVAQPAQLGADDRVGHALAGLHRGDAVVGVDPGHGVDLHPPGRDPEVVQDVLARRC